MKYRVTRIWREVEADSLQEAITTTHGEVDAVDEIHVQLTGSLRDPHGFAPGDPDIVMPRKLASELLERMEMARDGVEYSTGKRDDWARRIIAQLESLLKGASS